MDKNERCSLCGRPRKDVGILFQGVNGNICDDCIRRGYEILKEEEQFNGKGKTENKTVKLKKPKDNF